MKPLLLVAFLIAVIELTAGDPSPHRKERCSTCAESLKINAPSEILAALKNLPAETHSQTTFEGCSSDKGCAGLKIKDGRVIEKYGDIDAFKAAADSDVANEFSFQIGQNSHPKTPFGNSQFGGYEKFSQSSFSSGNVDISSNPFLNGQFNKGAFASKPAAYQASSFQSFSSSKDGVDISKNPFLNGGFNSKYTAYTGSSPRPFNKNFEQQNQQNIDEVFQDTGNVVAHEHGGELQQTCAGQGYVCVHKAQCNNGVVNTNGAGVLQARTKKQYCNIKTEICCRIEISNAPGAGGLQGSLGVGSATYNGQASQSQGGIFGAQGNGQSGSAFGAGAAGQSGSAFGANSAGQSGSAFGANSAGQSGSAFGANSAGQSGSAFGANSAGQSGSAYGANSAGQSGSGFGANSAGQSGSAFGANSAGQSGSAFGANSAGQSGSAFGANSAGQSGSAFGAGAAGQSGSVFGANSAGQSGSALGANSAGQSGSGSVNSFEQSESSFSESSYGQTGSKGSGNQGNFGNQAGNRGSQGSFGNRGTQGVGGSRGTQGTQGAQGAQGNQGGVYESSSSSFESSSYGNNNRGNNGGFGQGAQGTQGTQGTQNTQGTQFSATGQDSSNFGANTNTNNIGGNRGGVSTVETSSFESTSSTYGGNSDNSGFGNTGFGSTSQGTTGQGTTGQGSSTGTKYNGFNNNNFGSDSNDVQNTVQNNFIETDSFTSNSETSGVYRPGSSGSGLKPGVPYLPPVDNSNAGSNTVTTKSTTNTYSSPTPRPYTPRPYVPPVTTTAPSYLPPPQGEQSVNTETRVPGPVKPTYDEGSIILDENRPPRPKNPSPSQAPAPVDIPAGCAAALKCTPIEFCSAEGVITTTSVNLGPGQEAFRVPLTDCKDLQTGTIGKCCRDPNYSDPWPTNLIGKWTEGVFGGNDGKYTPDNRGSPNNPRPVVTGRPPASPVTGSVLLNNYRTTPKPIPTRGPNQVTPGFPGSTNAGPFKGPSDKKDQGTYTQIGQGQFGQGSQGQFGQGSQGQFGQGSQGFGSQTQSSQTSTSQSSFGQKQNNFGQKGQGQFTQQGQGQFGQSGQGQFGQGSKGQFGQAGQGTLEIQEQGSQTQFGQAQGTRGQGQTIRGQNGQAVSQGEGQFVQQGQGQFGVKGQGQTVTKVQGQFVSQGSQFGTKGQGATVSNGQGQFGQVGAGQSVSQGQGQFVSQGQGQFGSKGQGSSVNRGQGQIVQTGEGQSVSQGQGQFVSQGQGQFGTRGQGSAINRGQGQTVQTGETQFASQGSQFSSKGSSSGQGQLVQQGQGQYVQQGQGQIVSQGAGSGIRQSQGFAVAQSGSLGVENEIAETVQRVTLQRYNGAGECGVFNGQKPYGNHNELETDFAEIPWQAMVLLQTNRSLLCGGVITRPDVVLTSASCVEGLLAKNVLIKGGEWKLGIDDEPLPFQIVQVKHILRHPFYKAGTNQHDAAILILTENLRLAKNIYPICMPGQKNTLDAFYNGAGECIVTGWGKQVLQAHLAGAIMHSLNVSLINPGECQAKLSQDYPHLLDQYDHESCACGQPTNPINNICRVDTGSALACTMGDGHFVLRGIYSWDSGCQPGNQLAAFYKFDLEWYEWATGQIESVRFAQFSSASKLTQNKYSGQITNVKGGASGIKGNRFQGGSQSQFGGYSQGQTQFVEGQGYTQGQFGAGQSQFGAGQSQFGAGQSQFGAGQGQFGAGQVQVGQGQYSQFSSSKYQEANSGANFNVKPITNAFAATYSEKKVYQLPPKIISYTTKPEIVTFTTKPEYYTYTTKPEIITYTTKPKIVSYTTKPQIITYETSGTGNNPQYIAPGVPFNPTKGHVHSQQCECEGK